MSYIRLNIIEAERAINGVVHSSFADALVASLAVEPLTIAELETALARFIKPVSERSPLKCRVGECFEAYDAGVAVINLAGRVVAVDSSYSSPSAEGSVRVLDDSVKAADEDVVAPYRLFDDWLFIYTIPEYEGVCGKRRDECLRVEPIDARGVLYREVLLEFMAREVFAAKDAESE